MDFNITRADLLISRETHMAILTMTWVPLTNSVLEVPPLGSFLSLQCHCLCISAKWFLSGGLW